MTRIVTILFAAFVLGCGTSEPLCSDWVDITNRPVAYCSGENDDPVCDLEGDTARFEEGEMGVMLVGGERATCNEDFEVVCPTGTVGEPYCLTDPDL